MTDVTIEAGDRVHARKETPEGVIPLEFEVTAVTAGVVSGSPLGDLDPADGWSLEVTWKADPGLPETLSDLAAWTIYSPTAPIRILGPIDGVWRVNAGPTLDPHAVLAWQQWADYTPPDPDEITVPDDHPDTPRRED